MNKSLVWFALALFCMGCGAVGAVSGAPVRPPNIILILVDDAGYADFGFQGGADAQTPHIDQIAANGITYNNAYVTTPFCSPSRAGLLTGRYPQRFGYEFNLTHAPPPGVDPEFMGLAVEELTLADLLRTAGYATHAIGKWHLGTAKQFRPNVRGFDTFYGFLGGGARYHPDLLPDDGGLLRNDSAADAERYLTDEFADEAVAVIERRDNNPFFIYLSFNAVHTPMDVLASDLARFEHIEDLQRRRLMAMTWSLDRAVGRVISALHDNGLEEKTLIIFTNDNGGDQIGIAADNSPLRGTKGTLLEGGIRVPLAMHWPGIIPAAQTSEEIVSLLDIVPTAVTVAGLKLPQNLDGRSLITPTGQISGGHQALFWRYDVMAAVREGDWKLLRFPDRPPQLFNLASDVTESVNMADRQPDVANRLMKSVFEWESGLIHPRWNTGSYWTQEDVRRYDQTHVEEARAATKADLSGEVR